MVILDPKWLRMPFIKKTGLLEQVSYTTFTQHFVYKPYETGLTNVTCSSKTRTKSQKLFLNKGHLKSFRVRNNHFQVLKFSESVTVNLHPLIIWIRLISHKCGFGAHFVQILP